MKTILATIVLISSFSVLAEDGVLNALSSMFTRRSYVGQTLQNDFCVVQIMYGSDHAEILAAAGSRTVSHTIIAGSGYRFNGGRREFLSSDIYGTFRTLAVDNVQTYTVTAHTDRDGRETSVECIISL